MCQYIIATERCIIGEHDLSTTIDALRVRQDKLHLLGKLHQASARISGGGHKNFGIPLLCVGILIVYMTPRNCCVVILQVNLLPQSLLLLSQLCWNGLTLCKKAECEMNSSERQKQLLQQCAIKRNLIPLPKVSSSIAAFLSFVQSFKNGFLPSKASLIFLFRSYSSLSLPSRLFRYRYSLLSLAFLLSMALRYPSAVEGCHYQETKLW